VFAAAVEGTLDMDREFTFTVQTTTCASMKVRGFGCETVALWSARIASDTGIPVENQRLTIDLEADRTLSSYGIGQASIITVHDKSMHVLVTTTTTGKTINVFLDDDDTIENIKAKIHEFDGTPIFHQRLQYNNEPLMNWKKASNYDIISGCVIHLE
jgi:hypothetical protein